MIEKKKFDCIIIGESTLPIQCAEILLREGHAVAGVVTSDAGLLKWAQGRGIACANPSDDLVAFAGARPFDYLFSIVNGYILPIELLRLPRRSAINFHDGPLPKYAGFNTPAWALINREMDYGITWHEMGEKVDAGDIVKQRLFEIPAGETAFTLNAKCFEAGMESFAEMIAELASGLSEPQKQDSAGRTFFPRYNRPFAAGTLSFAKPAEEVDALVRALNWGAYPNPMGLPKLALGGQFYLAPELEVRPHASGLPAGTVVAVDETTLVVATALGDVAIRRLMRVDGAPLAISEFARQYSLIVGSRIGEVDPAIAKRVTEWANAVSRHEPYWVKRLSTLQPLPLGAGARGSDPAGYASIPVPLTEAVKKFIASSASSSASEILVAAFGAWLGRLHGESSFDLGFEDDAQSRELAGLESLFAAVVPLHVELDLAGSFESAVPVVGEQLALLRKHKTYARDLVVRYPELRSKTGLHRAPGFDVTVAVVDSVAGYRSAPAAVLTLLVARDGAACQWVYDTTALDGAAVQSMLDQFETLLSAIAGKPAQRIADLPLLSDNERRQLLVEWNDTQTDYSRDTCVHQFFEAQVERTPEAVALVYEEERLTYRELNARANQLAAHLKGLGIGREALVGIAMTRSTGMVAALLGVLKAGGAYVPIDPTYPRERQELILADARVSLLLTDQELAGTFTDPELRVIALDRDWPAIAGHAKDNARSAAGPEDLAYLIYTSGSTGKPKGVMVTHRNVANFFAGMDQKIGSATPGVWLAVTSISFDISVLELFWTLARGYQVVLLGEEHRALAPAPAPVDRKLDFSLFYFASYDGGDSRDKYRLLLEGARFADEHGFEAVWTPERHFHSFGGLYPNPSVTSAAVAATTRQVKIRAGSVVLPLHHPLRVAEEWSVVDNLSNGRVGISFASGWHARDFVLAPANYADNKNLMFRDIETVRKLWRGEAATFNDGKGSPAEVKILPRPVQRELPVWVTAAGSPDTFRMAGEKGYNLLTHLLGQGVEELTEKIALYRKAWRDAGHDASGGHVTLMLHTYVGGSMDEVREKVRKPFTDYLKTSVDLIKNSPWQFPAAKRPGGAPDQPLKLTDLAPEDLEALLEHAFERYFRTSGFFGTPDECLALAGRLQALGVDEIACLIDFGVDTNAVLSSLVHLNEVRERFQAGEQGARDYSPAGQIRRHNVTHMQCTPSMAKMLMLSPESRAVLGSLQKLMIGGEALPEALAAELKGLVQGEIHNMYGPTETTIWSTTHPIHDNGKVLIGRPIANTEIYVLDRNLQPAPVGVAGELFIGGDGVARGYFNRPQLTAERFIPNPFRGGPDARLYRTGDLVRYLPDGNLEFLGRLDHQVKIRGFRIELGEIESAIRQFPGVRDVVVDAREDAQGDKLLAAYFVAAQKHGIQSEELRGYLKAKLPEPMVPAAYVELEALPLTHNGKIDRKALPAPDRSTGAAKGSYLPPSNGLEQTIVNVWQEALNIDGIGLHDNFFDLGGHSILAVQVNQKLRTTLAREISLIEMFRYPTVQALAMHLSQDGSGTSRVDQGADRAQTRKESMLQRRQLRQREPAAKV